MAFESVKSLLRSQAEGKGLQPHPVLQDPTTPVSIVTSDGRRQRPLFTQREAQRHLDAYGGSQAIDWIMDAARFTADTVAGAEYHFEKAKKITDPRKMPGESAEPDARLKLLFDQPNKHTDYVEMMELLVIDLLLVGNAYLYKWRPNAEGQPLALYRLAPPHVKVKAESWGVGGYQYDVPDAGKLEIDDPTQVIHFKLSNPHSPYYGLGLIQGAGRAADLELALSDSQASYFENHAMPSLAVQSDRRVPRDVFKKIRAQLRAKTQGSRNAGEVMVLEAGLKLAAVAPNASQAGFAELSRMSRDRILTWFRLSPKLLGIVDEAGGSDKIADAQRIFDTKTARPLMNKIQRKISRELTQAWDLDYRIDYEYTMPLEDQVRLVSQFAGIPGVTVDEVRGYMNLGPHPDKTIGEMTLNLPGEEAGTGQPGETPTSNGFPDRSLAGEAGRPPNPSNTKAFPRRGGALPAGNAVRRGRKALEEAESLDDLLARLDRIAVENKALEQEGTVSVGATLKHERRPDSLLRQREAEVDAITADFERDLSEAARVLERDLLDEIEGKAFKPSDLVRRIRNSAAWRTFTRMAEQAYQRAVKRALSTSAVHQATQGITPEDEIDYDALAAELAHRKESGVRAITQTFRDRVARHLRAERDAGKSQAELRAIVQQTINDWRENQANAIALTEATRAYNEGTLTVAEAAGLTHVQVEDGDEHDEPCREADGSTWSIEHARDHALEHPRCRRAFTPISAVA